MTSTSERRHEQVGAFFAVNADRLERAVRPRVVGVGHEIIEDACQIAWTKLLRRPDITLDSRGFGWLATVAVHEAWRLRSTADEQPAGAFNGMQHDHGEMPEPADTEHRGTEDKALDRIEHVERLQVMQLLKSNEREALYLKGVGYTYQEIMRLTGASYTAVNRRITEGRAALRRHIGEASGPRRWESRANRAEQAARGASQPLARPRAGMMLITYRGRAVAMAGADRFYLAPLVDMRPSGDPLKTFVCFLALYARDVQCGALPGTPWRYLARIGERYAREALIPTRDFAPIQQHSDRELAEQFNVPVEEIPRRRDDLAGGGYRNVRRDRPQLCEGPAELRHVPAQGAIRCGLD